MAGNEVTQLTEEEQRIAALYSQEKEAQRTIFSDEQLQAIGGIDDALALFDGEALDSFADYGTGFRIVRDKRQLVDVPFVILEWRFTSGDMGGFVSFAAVTQSNDKVIVNDGSTGIREQLERVTMTRQKRGHNMPQHWLRVMGGLRMSEYEVDVPDERTGIVTKRKAATFYLAE